MHCDHSNGQLRVAEKYIARNSNNYNFSFSRYVSQENFLRACFVCFLAS